MSAATVLADLTTKFGRAWHVNATAILTYLATPLAQLLDVTAGTVTASSAVVVDASKNVSSFNNVGLAGTLAFGAGGLLDIDGGTDTCVGSSGTSTATVSKMAGIITTAALTTAAGSSHVITLTNTNAAAGDLVLIGRQGGTNTRKNLAIEAVVTSSTITITITNTEPTNAVNGTIILSFLLLKA